MSLGHNYKCESLFNCEQEELKLVLRYKENTFSSWDERIILVNFERKVCD